MFGVHCHHVVLQQQRCCLQGFAALQGNPGTFVPVTNHGELKEQHSLTLPCNTLHAIDPLLCFPLCSGFVQPLFAVLLAYFYVVLEGSIPALIEHFKSHGAIDGIRSAFYRPTWTSTAVIGFFMLFELALMKLPGKKVKGPITAKGHVPEYTANGFPAFLITLTTWSACTYFGLFPATIVYDNFCAIISSLCVFALLFCLVLYIKGLYFPSTPDHGSSGNPIVDYWWGTELYPNILGFDVKMFTNCRFGMNAWYLIVLSFAAKNAELNGGQVTYAMMVCASLITIYLGKFFWWEVRPLAWLLSCRA